MHVVDFDFLRFFGVLMTFFVCTFVVPLTWGGDGGDLGMGEGSCTVDVFDLDLAIVLSVSLSSSALRWIGVFPLADATELDVLGIFGSGLVNPPSTSLSCVLGTVGMMLDIDCLNDELFHRFLS